MYISVSKAIFLSPSTKGRFTLMDVLKEVYLRKDKQLTAPPGTSTLDLRLRVNDERDLVVRRAALIMKNLSKELFFKEHERPTPEDSAVPRNIIWKLLVSTPILTEQSEAERHLTK